MKQLLRGWRVDVPRDLVPVTSIDHGAECMPRDVGVASDARQSIWASVEAMYCTGLHPGISLVVRRRGRTLLKRAIGHARLPHPDDPDAPLRPMTADTPVCLFSASKAITALLLHKQVEQGRLSLDDKVADYLPEFAANGKGATTVRHLLAHQAGIPRVPLKEPDPSILYDWDGAVRMLCAAQAAAPGGQQQAYHAITAGYIVGELVQRVSGTPLAERLVEDFAVPLGCAALRFGRPGPLADRFAHSYSSGPKPVFPVSAVARRALGIAFEQVAPISNEQGFGASVIPAGNIHASAEEASRFFQMLLDGGHWDGQPVLASDTVAAAVEPVGPLRWDRTMLVPVRFSPGLVLGERLFGLYGQACARAFGHLGFINIVCWADPDRDLAVALLNTGKSLAPDSLPALAKVLWAISRHCPPRPG